MELQPGDFSLRAKCQRNVVAAFVSTAGRRKATTALWWIGFSEGHAKRNRRRRDFRRQSRSLSYGVASGSVQDDHGRDCSVYGYVRRMKFFLTFSLACVAAALAETATDESAAVLRAERDGCVAYLRGDADTIAKFLTDDYTLTNSKGEITTAADDIEDAKTGSVHYDVFENYDMKVRVYGDHTAIVTGKTKVQGHAQGKALDIIVQFTDTFVKQNGRWRLAAGHVSRLKE